MKPIKLLFTILVLLISVTIVVACTNESVTTEQNKTNSQDIESSLKLDVFKRESCGCCQGWIDHAESQGIQTDVDDIVFLTTKKQDLGIEPMYRSCHTSVSTEGYVFEGHIPVKFIVKYLDNVPQGSIGLSVPGMPVGSPGMENGDQFRPYQVLLLKDDGTAEVFAEVNSYEEQF
ncbi:DUF411 domain-containing protein [Alteromonas sp. A079]|jgi:hypothetical protein|uniref:DUF411 domain-containing protein n=1 Tax=Alteromonas sp. A079 TaxID=3410268 RepID=UPI003BA2B569